MVHAFAYSAMYGMKREDMKKIYVILRTKTNIVFTWFITEATSESRAGVGAGVQRRRAVVAGPARGAHRRGGTGARAAPPAAHRRRRVRGGGRQLYRIPQCC